MDLTHNSGRYECANLLTYLLGLVTALVTENICLLMISITSNYRLTYTLQYCLHMLNSF